MRANINIQNMDCIVAMKDMKDDQFDLAIVDPPYGIGSYWLKQKHTQHYGKKNWNEYSPPVEYFKHLKRVSKNQIIWGGNYFVKQLEITNSWIVWDKGNDVEKQNTSECELAWTSFKIPLRKIYIQWSGARKGTETGTKCVHPCQRPIKLYKWLLGRYANPGDKILDTHIGSGSMAIACWDMGYDLEGYEIDREYYNKACERFNRHCQQLQLF